MKNYLYIFLFSLFFSSCTGSTKIKKPNNLIPEDVMVNLITDMQLAVSAKNTKNKNNQRKVNYMQLVYKKYGIDSLLFKESNLYYTSQVDTHQKMLEKVHQKLTDQKVYYATIQKEKDSLKSIEKENKKIQIKNNE